MFPSLVYFLVLAREEPSYPFIGFNAVCLLVSITNLLLARFTEPGLLRTNPAMGSVPIQEFKHLVKRVVIPSWTLHEHAVHRQGGYGHVWGQGVYFV